MESRCIDAANYNNSIGYELKLGRYGYYILDVKATSLAGNGSWAGNISLNLVNIEGKYYDPRENLTSNCYIS